MLLVVMLDRFSASTNGIILFLLLAYWMLNPPTGEPPPPAVALQRDAEQYSIVRERVLNFSCKSDALLILEPSFLNDLNFT
jgi:hypothetical protein